MDTLIIIAIMVIVAFIPLTLRALHELVVTWRELVEVWRKDD